MDVLWLWHMTLFSARLCMLVLACNSMYNPVSGVTFFAHASEASTLKPNRVGWANGSVTFTIWLVWISRSQVHWYHICKSIACIFQSNGSDHRHVYVHRCGCSLVPFAFHHSRYIYSILISRLISRLHRLQTCAMYSIVEQWRAHAQCPLVIGCKQWKKCHDNN